MKAFMALFLSSPCVTFTEVLSSFILRPMGARQIPVSHFQAIILTVFSYSYTTSTICSLE